MIYSIDFKTTKINIIIFFVDDKKCKIATNIIIFVMFFAI